MDTTTLLIVILVLILLFGGAGTAADAGTKEVDRKLPWRRSEVCCRSKSSISASSSAAFKRYAMLPTNYLDA